MVTLDNGMTIEEAREAAKNKNTKPESVSKPGPLIDGKYDPKDFIKPKTKKKVVTNNNESLEGETETVDTDTTETTIDLDADFDFGFFQKYFNDIFEKEYSDPPSYEPPVFVPTIKQVEQMVPWLSKSGNLLQVYQDTWSETGDPNFALAAVRDSEDYNTIFPGNKRADGSVRHGESEYKAIESGYKNVLTENGLNFKTFENKFGTLISGAVSVQELSQRVGLVRRAIDENPDSDKVLEFYQENYGIEMSKEGLLAASIDPGISEDIFARRITMAEIGAEAKVVGAEISLGTISELASAGLTEEQAASLFTKASEEEKTLSALAAAQGREDITTEELVRADMLNDAETRKEVSRILQQSASQSSVSTGAKKSQTGSVTGLTEL
tara:strand:+ start:1896 stop:3044 length:1149 start_codon:yes stop_codon:yes gene_type:complete